MARPEPAAAPPPVDRPYVADLHIHSSYSRACSRDLTLPNLAWWSRRKGISVLGTGDFTHPAWYDHLRESLVPAEPGLFRLRPQPQADVDRRLPPILADEGAYTRFMLSVEISTIYKRDGATRKVHHLVYLPDLGAAARFNQVLGRIGNLGSDGRPILGLDSRDLLEITLTASEHGYLVPAHIWTPWFAALGSKSGFDAIADCYADLADEIFAVETGLSSDPAMNWRVSSLDRYQLVSHSDAHSPPALAREATRFTAALDYHAIRAALRTGDGLHDTIEFFPEEGKYHADGHRACDVRWDPERTRAAGGICPVCGHGLTVGVLSRIEELADRPAGATRPNAKPVTHLIPLAEVVGEIHGVGPRSKTVEGRIQHLVAALGPELDILTSVPLDEVGRAGGELLGEAIGRLRRGAVHRTPGYDGVYGVIKVFAPDELRRETAAQAEALFDVPAPRPAPAARPAVPAGRGGGDGAAAPVVADAPAAPVAAAARRGGDGAAARPATPPPAPAPRPAAVGPAGKASPHEPFEPMLAGMEEVGTGLLDRLDAMQRVAASVHSGPMLIVAGPGTGKTRTLTHRIAYLCAELNVNPQRCLAITFTRRAAQELRERLTDLLALDADQITVGTFHALALQLLREHPRAAGLADGFAIADEVQRAAARDEAGEDDAAYRKALRATNLVDLDELVPLAVAMLDGHPKLVREYRDRWVWIFVDEYQDVDADQYALLRLLSPADGNLYAIGDPDQAIYSFRGADVEYFLRFAHDFTDARQVRLTRNYRSAAPIVAAAVQAIAPTSLVRDRRLDPARLDPDAPLIGRYAARTPADEAEFVARTVDELVGGLSHRSFDGRVDARAAVPEALSFGDIAVLYRTDAQAAPIVDALSRANIPVQKRSHNRLRDRAGVAALARELRLASGGGAVPDRLAAAARKLADRHTAPTLDGAGAVTPEDVWAAADLLGPLAAQHAADPAAFLTAIATGAEVDALDPRAEAVTLLTLHASKGLEFPVVFLVGCEDGLLPLRLPGDPPSEGAVAEERRLFFVGLTRAQNRLYLSSAATRFRFGAQRDARVTPFLAAIDPGLLRTLHDTTVRAPRDRQLRLL
ncbi:UvrD-helicase domain-containing protein [Pilimelia anulata]|uniref:UvrD-helicase domain-containing protein n=1 Tax=Pilimelia anulata TaxID=53371 RepID=UPI00166E86E0|nr:UvrD-helicase domain-containing protein [Pilimelia anulata]